MCDVSKERTTHIINLFHNGLFAFFNLQQIHQHTNSYNKQQQDYNKRNDNDITQLSLTIKLIIDSIDFLLTSLVFIFYAFVLHRNEILLIENTIVISFTQTICFICFIGVARFIVNYRIQTIN